MTGSWARAGSKGRRSGRAARRSGPTRKSLSAAYFANTTCAESRGAARDFPRRRRAGSLSARALGVRGRIRIRRRGQNFLERRRPVFEDENGEGFGARVGRVSGNRVFVGRPEERLKIPPSAKSGATATLSSRPPSQENPPENARRNPRRRIGNRLHIFDWAMRPPRARIRNPPRKIRF